MILTILAIAGVAAAAWHVVRAAFRFLRQEATGIWADELSRTHARRGDLTSLEQARQEREAAARQRRRVLAEAVGWLALLLVPSFTPWGRMIYAGYAVLWTLPLLRRRSP